MNMLAKVELLLMFSCLQYDIYENSEMCLGITKSNDCPEGHDLNLLLYQTTKYYRKNLKTYIQNLLE